jgi:copper chaperone CopZ
MTVKQFFKSTAFKCLAVLMVIMLVCGVFLTLCDSIFSVSDQEKLDRAISKIYGASVTKEEIEITEANSTYDDATINSAYLITDDGNYLVNCTGKEGYEHGTVTCWVVVKMNAGAIAGVNKVMVDSSTAQTLMSYITTSYLNTFADKYTDGIKYSIDDGFAVTGASKSSNAICNSVNGALSFVKALTGAVEETPVNPFEGFDYVKKINTDKSSYTVEGDSVVYTLRTRAPLNPGAFEITVKVAKNAEGKAAITSFEITKNGGTTDDYKNNIHEFANYMVGKTADELLALIGTADGEFDNDAMDGELVTGATESNYMCTVTGLFATANYDKAIANDGGNA